MDNVYWTGKEKIDCGKHLHLQLHLDHKV